MNVAELYDLEAVERSGQFGRRHFHAVHAVLVSTPDHPVNKTNRRNDGNRERKLAQELQPADAVGDFTRIRTARWHNERNHPAKETNDVIDQQETHTDELADHQD